LLGQINENGGSVERWRNWEILPTKYPFYRKTNTNNCKQEFMHIYFLRQKLYNNTLAWTCSYSKSCSPRFLCRPTAFFPTCWSRGTSESSTYGKQRIFPCNSALAHFHVSWLSDFIFYPKPLYKSLHQSFFYSFITILPSESGVTLHYSTILPK
jgi:hypothetical protein